MKRTVRKVVTDARASCVGEEPGAGSCGWRRTYAGPRSQRSALEAARRHLDVANHASVVTTNIENVYSEWPDRHVLEVPSYDFGPGSILAKNTTITCDYCERDITDDPSTIHVSQTVTWTWQGWEPTPLQRGLDFCTEDHVVVWFREKAAPAAALAPQGEKETP